MEVRRRRALLSGEGDTRGSSFRRRAREHILLLEISRQSLGNSRSTRYHLDLEKSLWCIVASCC